MAKVCHDLGDESSAMTHARAAGVSAEQAEHPALQRPDVGGAAAVGELRDDRRGKEGAAVGAT
ncbi:hypothetical protein RB201_00145 [Streptomyces sp. S1A(2023)]